MQYYTSGYSYRWSWRLLSATTDHVLEVTNMLLDATRSPAGSSILLTDITYRSLFFSIEEADFTSLISSIVITDYTNIYS